MNVTIRCLTLGVALCAAHPISGWCDAKEDLIQLEQQRYDSLIAGDMSTFGAFMADEFFYNHSLGGKVTKVEYLANMDANVKVHKAVLDPPDVRLYGDLALVTGTSHISITLSGDPVTNHYRFLHVWQKKPEGWRLIARQATFLPKQN